MGNGYPARMTVLAVAEQARLIVGPDWVITDDAQLRVYECDGLTNHRTVPGAVILPGSTEEVAAVVRACHARRVPMVPFGVGSSLEGHVNALKGGVSIDLGRMNRILEVRPYDLDATLQAGVTRHQLEERLREDGVFF